MRAAKSLSSFSSGEKGHFSEQVPSLHTSRDSLPHGESFVSFDDHGEEGEAGVQLFLGYRSRSPDKCNKGHQIYIGNKSGGGGEKGSP